MQLPQPRTKSTFCLVPLKDVVNIISIVIVVGNEERYCGRYPILMQFSPLRRNKVDLIINSWSIVSHLFVSRFGAPITIIQYSGGNTPGRTKIYWTVVSTTIYSTIQFDFRPPRKLNYSHILWGGEQLALALTAKYFYGRRRPATSCYTYGPQSNGKWWSMDVFVYARNRKMD